MPTLSVAAVQARSTLVELVACAVRLEGGFGGWLPAISVAVYVCAVSGAMMSWLWPPPSDHDEKPYRVPFCVCAGAVTEFVEPTITCRVKGVAATRLPAVSCNPVGLDPNVSTT